MWGSAGIRRRTKDLTSALQRLHIMRIECQVSIEAVPIRYIHENEFALCRSCYKRNSAPHELESLDSLIQFAQIFSQN